MKIARMLPVALGLFALLMAANADARPRGIANKNQITAKKDGRWARPNVVKYYKARGLSTNIRVHKIRNSLRGKSTQVAVANKNSGRVRLFNVAHRTGKVSATRTGLVKQSTARGLAHTKLRRERAPLKGTFSGAYKSGLSRSGKTYKFTSKTDRNERAYVNIKSGNVYRIDPARKAPTAPPAAFAR